MLNSEITRLIVERLQSALRPLGFRRSKSTFTRDVGEVVQLINVQKSTSSDASRIKLTVNLGLWLKALAPVRAGVPDEPDIWSSHWQVRIGHLAPERRDHWWEAGTIAQGEEVGQQLVSHVLAAIPHMEALSSTESLIRLWESGQAPGLTEVERRRNLEKLDGPAA